MESKLTVYTIGHSNKTSADMVEKLKENGVQVLVDVRTIPYSKYNPQFNREAFRGVLADVGINYVYRGKNLGGKGGKLANTGWDEAIDELIANCGKKKICVMCSEGDPNDCHRHSTIEPDLVAKGVEVVHILWSPAKRKDGKIKEDREFGKLQGTLF